MSGANRIAADLTARGVRVAAVIPPRPGGACCRAGVAHVRGEAAPATSGRMGLRSIPLTDGRRLACDALALSGGGNPNVHLTCHLRGWPVWRDPIVNSAGATPGSTCRTTRRRRAFIRPTATASSHPLPVGHSLPRSLRIPSALMIDCAISSVVVRFAIACLRMIA